MKRGSTSIKAVIFDFGGVLVRTESQEPRERLACKHNLTLEGLYHLVFDGEESRLAQLGLAHPDARWERVAAQLGLRTKEEQMDLRRIMFSTDVLDQELVRYIRNLRPRFKTALLSNASLRLETTLRDELKIEDCFDVIVISAQVGLMKPDPAIYRLTLERLQVAPQEAVFIDDAPPNVEAAAQLGIHAICFTGREAALAEMEVLLNPVQTSIHPT